MAEIEQLGKMLNPSWGEKIVNTETCRAAQVAGVAIGLYELTPNEDGKTADGRHVGAIDSWDDAEAWVNGTKELSEMNVVRIYG